MVERILLPTYITSFFFSFSFINFYVYTLSPKQQKNGWTYILQQTFI